MTAAEHTGGTGPGCTQTTRGPACTDRTAPEPTRIYLNYLINS